LRNGGRTFIRKHAKGASASPIYWGRRFIRANKTKQHRSERESARERKKRSTHCGVYASRRRAECTVLCKTRGNKPYRRGLKNIHTRCPLNSEDEMATGHVRHGILKAHLQQPVCRVHLHKLSVQILLVPVLVYQLLLKLLELLLQRLLPGQAVFQEHRLLAQRQERRWRLSWHFGAFFTAVRAGPHTRGWAVF